MPKLRVLRARLRERGQRVDLSVDGGIDAGTVATAADAGANVFIAGTSLYAQKDMQAGVQRLRALAAAAFRAAGG
jgi:ribulose-phosphate 3-epimerase